MTARSEARDELKSYIERIERLVEEIKGLKEDQKALFAEAADALVENLLGQLKAGALNLTLMGRPTSIQGDS